jgi:NADH-quinone oxidoreductase subunit J
MIGAIVLTLRHKVAVKRQSIAAQVARRKGAAVEIVKVAPGTATVPPAARSS